MCCRFRIIQLKLDVAVVEAKSLVELPDLLAYNVLRLPTAREPTVRAAEGCPPPRPRGPQPRPRWQAAAGRAAAKACYLLLELAAASLPRQGTACVVSVR
jgi:hypothetical protein